MADFLLSVGVDVGLSYTQMQNDISTLVSQLNSNPPRILVSLETDPAAVSQLRSQIDAINQAVNAVGSTATGSGTRAIANEINNIAREAQNAARVQVSAANQATAAQDQQAVSLRQVLDSYRQMLALMRTNANASTTSTFATLATQAELFGQALQIAEQEAISIDLALQRVGLDAGTAIESARTAMSAFRTEMEQTGTSGTVSMQQMYAVVAQMQTLLNNNTNYAQLPTYTALYNQVTLFAQALQLASTNGMTLEAALTQVGLNASTALGDARTAMSAFKMEMSGATAEEETLVAGTQSYNTALNKVNTLLVQVRHNTEKWSAAKNGKSATDYQTYSQQAAALESLAQRLQTGAITAQEFNREYSQIRNTVVSAGANIKAAGEATQTWSERISGLTAKFGTWFSITRVIMAAYRAVRAMVESVIDLDTAMTELKKVTNETEATYERFLENATIRAKRLGAALSDTVTATADFARLGYGIEDAEKLADAAIVYKNVGDGIDDISTASESIIATMQAFGVSAEDVMSIVDKFNDVGNNYAISSKGVGDALLRSAAAMHAANNSLDESIALATAANTIVQDPEKVGTTLKTVSMYLRAAKTEAEEAGESTDGMANSVSELREEILSLTGNRVDIQIDEDTFKSTYQIMKELSEVWSSLTDVTQANITELVGGKRNSNVVSALLENFTVAEEALKTSAQSAGSALTENEKVLESIQGKINIMKASFETFAQNFIGGDLVKFFVELATSLLNVLNGVAKFVNALGGLKTVLLAVTSVLLISKGGLIAYKATLLGVAAVEKIIAFFTNLRAGISTIMNIIPNAIVAWKSYAAGVVSANTAMQASIPVIGLVLAAVSALVAVFSLCSDSTEETVKDMATLKSEMVSLSDTIQSTASDFRSMRDSTADIIPRFVELANGVNQLGENVGLTDEEYSEFLSLNNKIAEMFPELNMGMDSNGNAMLTLSYTADTLAESLWKVVEAERAAANIELAKTMPELMSNISAQMTEYQSQIETVTSETESALKTMQDKAKGSYDWKLNTTSSDPEKVGKFSKAYYNYIDTLKKYGIDYEIKKPAPASLYVDVVIKDQEAAEKVLREATEKHTNNIKNEMATVWSELNTVASAWMSTNPLYDSMNDTMQQLAQYMVAGLDFENLNLTTAEDVQNYITANIIRPLYNSGEEVKTAFAEITNLRKQLDAGEISENEFSTQATAAFTGLIDSMDANKVDAFKSLFVKSLNEMGIEGSDFNTVVAGLIEEWSKVPGTAGAASTSLSGLSETLQKLKSAYSVLETAQKEMAEGGLSADTIKALADETDDYLDYLYEENGVVKLNIDAWKERANMQMEGNIAAIEAEIASLEEERKTIQANLTEWENKDGRYRSKNDMIAKYTAELDANTAAIEANQAKLGIYNTLYNDITGSLDAYSAALQNFSNIANAITSVSDSLTTVADLQETVANGFTISLEKALEFAKVYPEIMNGATVAADGQIALNENIVNAFIEGKEAELKAQIDAEVAKLEADKAVLTAKMEFSKAQLELAKSVGTGEGQISKEVAEYRVNAGNAVAQALIAAGIDEATAYQLACAAMAQNSEEFNRVAAEVCTDVQGNFNQAAYDAAQAIYTNMQNSKLSIASVAAQAHEAAKAIAGIASGTVQGSSSVQGGGAGGSYTGKGNISVHSGSFKGTEYTYEAKTISLEDFISDLELDISNYQQAISQIDGQIATLKALRNTSLNKFSTSNKNASKGSGSKSGSSKDDEPTWFEKEYALHQHLLKMDAENVEDYLDWLNSAYQRAYKEGIIDLDDYYKYQEEVYTGLQDLFKDYLNDVEHEISMRENYEGESDKIIELYKKLMKDVEKEIAAARAQGLDDTDDYIQELQSKWQGYAESVKEMQEDATESAKDAVAELVDYRIDMIKQDIENEKDALDKKLDYLKEFYDKQKDMLQDQYDEEQYLKEQAEKRKSVSDLRSEIAMLENDDSAWAQKRKLELQEELATAEDDLGTFEDEHALDLALDALDNAYNAQEAQIQAEMDALEEKLNDPEALYNQALTEIKNNTGNLYQEMLEYNRKHGTGNDEDVKDIYEEAYKALLEYKDIYGKDYEGVVLTNSTNYKPDTGSWDTEKISGTNPNNQPKEEPKKEEPKKEEPKNTAPSLSKGSTITVKKSATHFGSKSNGVRMASFVPGGSYTVYQTSGNQVLIGRNGVYTGWINKSDIVGYAKGTKNATAGLHSLDELGSEYLFTSTDGNKYRVLSSGDKVLNARATDFLYEFANGGGEILEKIIKSAFGTSLFDHIQPVVNHNEIDMGDVIVQGSATQQTVSEIRRAQRDNLTEMLKSLNKLNK